MISLCDEMISWWPKGAVVVPDLGRGRQTMYLGDPFIKFDEECTDLLRKGRTILHIISVSIHVRTSL